ncbi:uncharacterized protein VICG_00970 [Vittaforma corneae ATCC 50505]|uniref:SWIM-type domain-containing protein n=1 Tax=Vittaforma corneae (strain ATCC 50505) TaxID=993615 RepID=L2GM35_VITCO|nr:uncharacterized protein VICG_00970 [Vittaforma corneae ATCC 50505]ELA41953.1 hypothetical protein VICG_00970 [Vittaforma corneae ATCC 50505]
MTPDTFVHRGDLVNEMNRLGALYDIKEEFMDAQNVFVLCCSNKSERCEARIIGLYSQKDKLYHIRKLDSIHSCSKNTKRELALQHELSKYRNSYKRTGELVECLYGKFKAGYFDVFKANIKCNQGYETHTASRFEFFEKENNMNNSIINTNIVNSQGNAVINGNISADALFIKENQMFEYDSCRDSVISQKTDDSKHECICALREELMMLNPHITCEFSRNNFFFKHTQMSRFLRKTCEIGILPRINGTIIFGFLFDPNDDHIIQSVLVSEESKLKALEIFLEYDRQHSENTNDDARNSSTEFKNGSDESSATAKLLYIVDMDFDVVEYLSSKNHPFFIKSRSVFQYLQDPKEDDQNLQNYFNEINYGEKEFLELDKATYLKKFCPVNLYNLNNAHYPDFEYITPYILSLSFVDCITSLIWLISEDIKNRKTIVGEDCASRISESIAGIFEEYNDVEPTVDCEVNLSEGTCECGKYQEFLFPCIHAYKKIKEIGKDPILYTSNIYNKENLLKIKDIIPVVNVKIHPFKPKAVAKKRKGELDSSGEKQY